MNTLSHTTGIGVNLPHYCHHCDCYHTGTCSKIKAIEYYPDGTVKRVEYYDPPMLPTRLAPLPNPYPFTESWRIPLSYQEGKLIC
jgi:hypothetical protein